MIILFGIYLVIVEVGVISILDAATNDLASLINRLDLEATPGSTASSAKKNMSPLIPFGSPVNALLGADGSPIKRRSLKEDREFFPALPENTPSIASLRPYVHAQTLSKLTAKSPPSQPRKPQIGQQIASWSELDWEISPKKPIVPKPVVARQLTSECSHLLLLLNLPVVFQPLQPAKRNISPIL